MIGGPGAFEAPIGTLCAAHPQSKLPAEVHRKVKVRPGTKRSNKNTHARTSESATIITRRPRRASTSASGTQGVITGTTTLTINPRIRQGRGRPPQSRRGRNGIGWRVLCPVRKPTQVVRREPSACSSRRLASTCIRLAFRPPPTANDHDRPNHRLYHSPFLSKPACTRNHTGNRASL